MAGPHDSERHPDDWWLSSDGHWYPPSLAHHPAAQREMAATRALQITDAPADPPVVITTSRRAWVFWAALLVPLLLLAGLLLMMFGLATGSHISRTETAGEGAGSSATTGPTTSRPSTTVPATATQRPPPVPSGQVPGAIGDSEPGAATPGAPANPSSHPAGGHQSSDIGPSPSPGPGPSPGGAPGPDPTPTPTSAPSPGPGPGPGPTVPPPDDPPSGQVPTNKEQCMNGGWAGLEDDRGQPFANQGQCIAFVQGR